MKTFVHFVNVLNMIYFLSLYKNNHVKMNENKMFFIFTHVFLYFILLFIA